MCEPEEQGNAVQGRLANSDAVEIPDSVSLSDSDPEDSGALFDAEVEDLSSGEEGSPDGDGVEYAPIRAATATRASAEPSFQLKGGGADFSSRSQNIFQGLENAAKLATPKLGEDNLVDGPFVRPMLPLAPKKREVAPGRPASLSRGVPDYLAHPERWTRYSLEDVPETSNSKNSLVAQEYIQSLQQRKGTSDAPSREPFTPTFNQHQSSCSDSKILFSRPTRKTEGTKPREGHAPEGDRKQEVGLFHLVEPEEEAKATQPSAREGKRKRDSGDGEEDPKVGFKGSRKVNRKNFRRVAENEDD